MKKSVVQEKSKGILLFAFNTNAVDYVKIAERSARLAKSTLGLPITLVTDSPATNTIFDRVIQVDNALQNYKPGQSNYVWRNGDRYRAYELSPYDETILIDSDYLILDDSILKLFDQEFDYRIMTHNQTPDNAWNETMGIFGLQYQWATVISFKKTKKSKMLFDLAGRIQRNYRYYVNLYHIGRSNFRNDYAFTIANNILNGYNQEMSDGIPWKMLTFANGISSLTIKDTIITVKELDKAYLIPRQNIHVMDKNYLLTDNFEDFVRTVCE